MPNSAHYLEEARAAHRAGDFPRAEQLCRGRLDAQPADAEAWRLLASVLQAQNKVADAVAAWKGLLRLRPEDADACSGLGAALAALGRRDEAAGCFRRVAQLHPGDPDAAGRLGVALAELGKLDEAVAELRRAASLRPDFAPAFHNLGVALAQQGNLDEAARALERAVQVQPDYPEAHYNLGNVLQSQGRRDDALARYREAVRLRPRYGEAHNNLGLLLTEAGRHGEAAVILQQAVRLRPRAVEAHNNLGLASTALGRFAEAEACFQKALEIDPGYVEAHNNLASAWKEQGRLEEALAGYAVALRLDPQSASTRYNRSLALLQNADYAEGWREYEHRWRRRQTPPRPFSQPRWDGSPLEGKTVLLWCEQGLGDAIQFLRYAPLVQAKGGRVVLECPGFMLPLFSTCAGIDRLVAEGSALPEFDVQAPLMSLPGLLGTTPETVPAEAPYLSADPGRVEAWRAKLEAVGGFKVGVVWQGNPHHPWDRWRSVPLGRLAPLAAVEGVRLVSLQKGAGAEQVKALKGRFEVVEFGEELDREGGAFLDTAAILKGLDLVVTTDTSAAHLAGALGVPTWLALGAVADWRWLVGREDSPWYPTMRLFRQRALGDWDEVFRRMAAELPRLVAGKAEGRLVRAELSPGEALDRMAILEIKTERITDPAKLRLVREELAALREACARSVPDAEGLAGLRAELMAVNEVLWEAEDGLRACERAGDFGERFVALARSVYRSNDGRAGLKRRINELLRSRWTEQKQYGPGA